MSHDPRSIAPNPRCLLTELGDGTGVLLHLDTKFYYTLNRTGLTLWKALAAEPRKRAADLTTHLVESFQVDATTAARDVDAVLGELAGEGLVTYVR